MIYCRYRNFEVLFQTFPCMNMDDVVMIEFDIYDGQQICTNVMPLSLHIVVNRLYLRKFFEDQYNDHITRRNPLLYCASRDRNILRKQWKKLISYYKLTDNSKKCLTINDLFTNGSGKN